MTRAFLVAGTVSVALHGGALLAIPESWTVPAVSIAPGGDVEIVLLSLPDRDAPVPKRDGTEIDVEQLVAETAHGAVASRSQPALPPPAAIPLVELPGRTVGASTAALATVPARAISEAPADATSVPGASRAASGAPPLRLAPLRVPAVGQPLPDRPPQDQETHGALPASSNPGAIAPPASILCDPPAYPRAARERGWEGDVLLHIHVLASGRVGAVQVQESCGHPMLDGAAAAAARRWRFHPARRGGEPIDWWVQVPVQFRLRE